MRPVVTALLLASCRGEPTPPVANVGGAPVTAMPAGWVAIEPDDERLRCANHANDEWQVAIDHGTLAVTEAKPHEPDTGPSLPFTPTQQPATRGRRHVLAVSDGFLVGYDAGEWGGALYWYSPDGKTETKLTDENVHGLIALGPDVVGAIEGLSHLVTSDGSVHWIEHAGAWHAGALTPLDAGPSTFAAAIDAIYVVTATSLVRIGRDRKATVIQPMQTALLYPDSMVVAPDGVLWIGMRQFVVRMAPNGKQFTQTWFVRDSCVRATVRGLECICAKERA